MIDCERFLRCLSDYLDGELYVDIRAEFEVHIRTCSSARAMIHTMEQTIVLHRTARGRALPTGVKSRLREALEKCMDCSE